MLSCIYEGRVEHRRFSPADHRFRYRLFMVYLDLDELPGLLQSRAGLHQAYFSPASFRRQDHLGDPALPLKESVCRLVRERTGLEAAGPVRLLTLLRNFGYYFSPLNVYFCFDAEDRNVAAVVAEVSNTPWLEKHCYVLWDGNRVGQGDQLRFRHPKDFHVSPFMDMKGEYEWRMSQPGDRLTMFIASPRQGQRFFEVTMVLKRRELGPGAMVRTMASHPWMTARVTQAIYWQALRLWHKKCPYYSHPRNSGGDESHRS